MSVGSLPVDLCIGERLVIGIDMELVTCNEVLESLDCLVDSKKFSVDGTVLCFDVVELLGEENNGLPASVDILLQDGTSTDA